MSGGRPQALRAPWRRQLDGAVRVPRGRASCRRCSPDQVGGGQSPGVTVTRRPEAGGDRLREAAPVEARSAERARPGALARVGRQTPSRGRRPAVIT